MLSPAAYLGFFDGLLEIALDPAAPTDLAARAASTICLTADRIGFGPDSEIEQRLLDAVRCQGSARLSRMASLSLVQFLARIGRPIDLGSVAQPQCFVIDAERRRLVPISHGRAVEIWRELRALLARAPADAKGTQTTMK